MAPDGMTPRGAGVNTGRRAISTGVLPSQVPVYVWFGDLAIVRGVMTADGLVVDIPMGVSPGLVDTHVRFRTDRDHNLTLTDAFTFHPDHSTQPPTSDTPGSPSPAPPPAPAPAPTRSQRCSFVPSWQ